MTFPKHIQSAFFASTLAALVFFFILKPSINAPFTIMDDHMFIAVNSGNKKLPNGLNNKTYHSYTNILKFDIELGRFRPVYQAIHFYKAKLFKINPKLYHLSNFILAIICFYLFYLIIFELTRNIKWAWIFSFLFLFNNYDEIWWSLGPAETPGILFFLAGIYLLVHSNKHVILSVSFLFLSSLCKENFIVLLPIVGLLFLKYRFDKNNHPSIKDLIKTNRTFCLLLTLVCIFSFSGLIGTLLIKKSIFNYGEAKSLIDINLQSMIALLLSSGFFIMLHAFFNKTIYKSKTLQQNLIDLSLIIFLFVSILIVYKDTVIIGRYLVPGSIMLMLLLANYLGKYDSSLILRRSAVIVLILIMVNNTKNIFFSSRRYSQEAVCFNNMTNSILAKEKKDKYLIFRINPNSELLSFEFIYSTIQHLIIYNYCPIEVIILNDTKFDSKNINQFNQLLLAKLNERFRFIDYETFKRNYSGNDALIISDEKPSILYNGMTISKFREVFNDFSFKDCRLKQKEICFYTIQ